MTDADAPGNEPIAAAARDSSGQDADPALAAEEVVDESDAKLPAPLNNGAYRKILKELPDGPRIAAETCVQFWKVLLAGAPSCMPARSDCAHGCAALNLLSERHDGRGSGGGVWQDKKVPTEELVAFLKTISVHRCVSLNARLCVISVCARLSELSRSVPDMNPSSSCAAPL